MGRKDIGVFFSAGYLVSNRRPIKDILEKDQITSSGFCEVICLEEIQDSCFFGRSKESRCFRRS